MAIDDPRYWNNNLRWEEPVVITHRPKVCKSIEVATGGYIVTYDDALGNTCKAVFSSFSGVVAFLWERPGVEPEKTPEWVENLRVRGDAYRQRALALIKQCQHLRSVIARQEGMLYNVAESHDSLLSFISKRNIEIEKLRKALRELQSIFGKPEHYSSEIPDDDDEIINNFIIAELIDNALNNDDNDH